VEVTVRSICFALFLSVAAVPLYAQSRESRGTVSAVGGIGTTWDDEGSLGRGWLIGGAADRVIFGTTRIEGSLEVLTHDRNAGHFQSNGQTIIAGASLVHRFGRGTSQPYVFGGLTIGHHSGTNSFSGTSVPLSVTNAGYRGGGGIAFRAGNRLEIAPELRWNGFFVDADPDPVWLPSFGIRLGWRM
jgi:hypothetical protein